MQELFEYRSNAHHSAEKAERHTMFPSCPSGLMSGHQHLTMPCSLAGPTRLTHFSVLWSSAAAAGAAAARRARRGAKRLQGCAAEPGLPLERHRPTERHPGMTAGGMNAGVVELRTVPAVF